MPKTAAKIKQADISRVIKAAKQNGLDNLSIEIRPDGTVAFNLDTKPTPDSRYAAGAKQKAWAPL